MEAPDVQRAVAAAKSLAETLDLAGEDALVLHNSNRLVLRLMPCDVVARVATMGYKTGSAELEVEVARRLAEAGSPVATLEPRVEPRVYERDSFVINLWTYYEPLTPRDLPPIDYAHALARLHTGMRQIDLTTPHFTDRVADTQQWVADRNVTPELAEDDRQLIINTLGNLRRSIVNRGAVEQLLHGEPHPWNVLTTNDGPLFFDFENCTHGPVEYDLAWVPVEVSELYPGADHELVAECRGLMLAIIAAWRWRRDDQHPSREARQQWLSAFRQGPPWLAVDDV